MDAQTIDESEIGKAAESLGVERAVIEAIIEVESGGDPFLGDGRTRILFERHIFSRLTGGRYDDEAPDISNPNSGGYVGGPAEWDRLKAAADLDREAALKSASWGAFQIMGFNHQRCGYEDVEAFTDAMAGVGAQVRAVIAFIKSHEMMLQALQSRDWSGFASRYNGPGYRRNSYDARLRNAWLEARRRRWKHVQGALNARGAALKVDGVVGPLTRGAWDKVVPDHFLPTSPDKALAIVTAIPFPENRSSST